MNPFISIYELVEIQEKTLLYCKDDGAIAMFSIPGSVTFTVPKQPELFIHKIQSLSLGESKRIVCYDKGDLIPAGKVYWGLRAAGFENISLMLGGIYLYNDLGYEVSTFPVEEIVSEDQNYLPFNNSILQISEGAPKKSSYYQLIRTDEDIPITTPRGQILPKENLLNILKDNGIKHKPGKPMQLYGKFSIITACVFIYLGESHVSVALDNTEQVYLTRTNRSIMSPDEGSDVSLRAYSVHENSHYDSTHIAPVEPKHSASRKAGTICGNCIVI